MKRSTVQYEVIHRDVPVAGLVEVLEEPLDLGHVGPGAAPC